MGKNDVNNIFFASLILYSQLLQFKVDLFSNIPFHKIEMLNIAK